MSRAGAHSREGLEYFGEGLACFEQGVWLTLREGLVYFSGRSGLLLRVCRLRLNGVLVHPLGLPLAGPCALSGETGLVYFWLGLAYFSARSGLLWEGSGLRLKEGLDYL